MDLDLEDLLADEETKPNRKAGWVRLDAEQLGRDLADETRTQVIKILQPLVKRILDLEKRLAVVDGKRRP